MSKLSTTEARLKSWSSPDRSALENGIPGSDQGMVDFPAVVFGHLVVRRSGASRIPCGGPARTYVVGWVQQLVQELSYLSMGNGHPWQTHPPNHHTPLHMVEVSPLADVRRRSVQPAGVDVWVSTGWKNLCRPHKFLILLGPDYHPEILLQFRIQLTSDKLLHNQLLPQFRWTLRVPHSA